MTLNLMYITNNPEIASIADNAGVDWIFIDLEINGKEQRQGHLDTVISKHSLSDIKPVKMVLKHSKLLVRVNPIYDNSKKEIDFAIENGADIIMLPFFKTVNEVKQFINIVNGRAKTCLLLETPEAVDVIDSILEIESIDMIHIGLNDLHLGYSMKFMFEPLANGLVEKIGKKVLSKSIEFGFGGIAQIGQGILPAENIIIEHYRLGSTMAILSRTFCDMKKKDSLVNVKTLFNNEVMNIRNLENLISEFDIKMFEENHKQVIKTINEIVNKVN